MSLTELPLPRRPEATEPARPAARAADTPGGRWQPHRAGILNVWRYYDETFTFHRGRLLLRGQNGSGKSKALELLLPFLFDASLRPNRLSTFGGSERTMHWNLLGEGATGKTRVGYVWMEFRRVDDDGTERFFGCGARLQASVHTTAVHADYFTTGARIARPDGVLLVSEAGQPLTRAALAEALGDRGEVHTSATGHRTAVRRALFAGMGEQRYESLLSALLQLRQPKLSERLDPSLLSSLLSRALPPLGEGEIAELAAGFAQLDRRREHLRRLDDEVAAAETLARAQRAYARRVLRAGAAALIEATAEADDLTRAARTSAEDFAQALAQRASARALREEQEGRARALEETVEGLRQSEASGRGEGLDRLRRRTEDAVVAAARRRALARAARAAAERDRALADGTAGRARTLDEHARDAAGEARGSARAAGLESVHDEAGILLGATDAPRRAADDPPGDSGARQARLLLRRAVTVRRQQLTAVTAALDEHDRAVRDRGAAQELLDEARARFAEASARRDEAAGAWDTALAAQGERLLAWAASCTELRIADAGDLAAGAAAESEVTALVEAAARPLEREITTAEATVRAARPGLWDERGRLVEEMQRLGDETDVPPPAPATRTTVRSATAGAPLWRLIAFRESVPMPVQAAVEAALEASGLLDAWVGPYGGITLPGHDTRAESALAVAAPGHSLLAVLRPEEGIPVPVDTVNRILAGVAFGAGLPDGHAAAVSAQGAWRLALATGSWSKQEPVYIGAAARQRARQRAIAALTDGITRTSASLAALDDRSRDLAARRARLDADLAARPDHRELAAPRRERDRAEEAVAAHDDAVRHAARRLARCEDEVAGALREFSRRAAEHALPADRDRLRALDAGLDRFRDTADGWVDARLAAHGAADTARQAAEHADRSERAADEHTGDAAAAEAEAAGLRARLEAAQAGAGADHRQIVARLAEAREELRRCRDAVARAADLQLRLEGRAGGLRAVSGQDAARHEQAVLARDRAAHRLRHLCLAGLAEDASLAPVPDVGLAPVPDAGLAPVPDAGDDLGATLQTARAIAAEWPTVPYAPRHLGEAATRLSEAVHEARRHLGAGADLDLVADDDVQIFSATLDGVRVGAAGLLGALARQRDSGRDDLTGGERHLFDQILAGDVRRHLAVRIRRAGELVDRMNEHLERVRTASRVAVRLVWDVRPDLPDGTRTARELLLMDPGRVTESDREALHAFLRARIGEAGGGDTAVTWEEQLGEVLDYTAWHRFTVHLDRAGGTGWQPLTKKLHGALSGGEKAIALHLPLFAAVAAHYEAVPLAPRPILLDEVFVGVDTVNRGQVFGLLTALDLDLMVTSDHEWCTYGELPGIAVHQLLTDGHDDAVTSARFVWNGADLETG
ncbi:TIGR02680 family protein [Streptomyces scabiei]|uniref:TIGR02680 family protein n=1 Tax=Streptomyces scabiei TaxID=1930 RepID=UPI0038F646DA